MNLGELIVELCADTAQLEKSLEQAKKKAYEAAASIEKSFDKINLEINVDDDSLTGLNKHLNLKVQHLKEVNKYFNNNPIVVNVDDDQLVDLNKHLHTKVQHLKEVNKYFSSNPIIAKVNIEDDGLTELQNKLNNLHQKKVVVSVDLNDNTFSSVSFNFSNSDNNFAIINQLRSINRSINSISQSIIFVNTSIITGNNLIVEAINNLGTANNTTSNAVKSDTRDIDREQSALSQQQSQGTRAIVDNSSKEVVNQLKSVKKSIITTAKPDIKQSLATGVTEEFGRVIGKNLMLGFKKNLGVDLAGATQSFTKVISKPFAKVTPESIQKFEDEIVSALEDAFVFNNQSQAESKFRKAFQPIVDEILEIAFTATGQILGVAAQPLRIRKRVLLAQSAQDSAKLSESIPVPNDNENIKKAKSISLITGGIDFQKGGLNTFFAENLVKRILPGSYSVPVTNPYSNDKSNLGQIYQFRAKLSNEMIIGADGIARPSSEPMPLDMLLHTNIEKGYNPDSIKMAAEAMAYRKKYPDKPIQLLGTSGGSYIVEEAIAILERAGIKNIKGLGLTAPVNDLMTTANRKNYKSLVGEFDPLNVAMFGGKNVQDKDHPVYIATKKEIPFGLPGLLKESPLMSLIPSAGKGHALLPFLTKPMVVEQIQSFLGEAIDPISPAFSKGIKSEPNLHFYKFQQDEKNALVKTFKAILGDGSTLKQIEKAGFIGSEGYTFAVPQRPEWRRENDFSAMMGNLPNPKSISKEIKPEFDEYLSFLKEMRLGIVEFLDSGAKSRQSLITALEQAIRFYPELKTLQFRVLETLEEQARLTDLNKNSKTDIRTARERYKDNQRLARINTQFPQGQEYLKDFKNREKDVKLSPKITQIDSSKPKNQSAESLLHASNPDDIKDIGLPKNLSNVPDLVDSTDSALNQAAIKLENAASLLIDAVNSLNNLVANLKVSSLNTQKTQFQSVVSRQKKASLSNSLEFNAISSTTPEPIKKQLEAIQSGLIKGVDLSQRYKDATQAENNAAVPDLTQSSIIEQIKKESDISLNEIKVALDTINKIFSAEYKELAAEFEVSKKSGNLDIIKATKNKLREFISRSKEAITTIDKYVDIGRQAGFETSFNSELTSIKRKGKSGIRKNEKATDEKVGRLNYIEVELYNAKLTEQIALAEQQGVDIGKHINDGLKNGIKHNINGVSDEAKKMLNDLIATIKDTLDIQSPSKVMFDIGKNVITGLLFGFIDNLTVLKQVAKQIPNTVINTVEKGFEIQSPSLWGWRTGKNIGDTIGNSAVRSLFLANLRIAKMLDTIKEHEKGIRPYLVGSQVRLIETGQDNRLSERQKEKITDYLSNTKDILNRVLIDPISADPNEQIRELTANLQRARNILIQKVSDSVVSAIISISNNTSGQNTLFGTRYNKFAMQPGRAIRSLPASVDYRHNNAIRNRLFETQQQGQSSINYYNESIRARLREIEQPIRYTRRLPAAAAPIGLLPSSNIWDRPIDFSQVQQQRPTATSVPTIIPMLPPARTQRIAGYFGLSELDRRNRAVLDRRNARNRLRELQNQVEQTIDVDFEPVAPQPQQRTTPVTSRQSLPQLPSFLSSTRQQIHRSTISDILSFVISRTSQRTTSPQLPNLTQTATQQPQQPQSPSFTISGASRQSRPPQLPSFLSSTTQQIPQTQQPLSSPSFVISNVSPRNTSRSLQLPNFSQIGTQPSPSIQSTQQTATLPNVTQIAQPITQPVNFTPKYEKNWLVRLGIQMGRIVGEGFKTAFEMFGNKTFQALVKEVNKIKSAVENNTISLDAEAIRAGMSRGFKKGFNSIKGIKDIKKEFDTYIDFFQKVATPNVSSALGEGFGNNLVGMKELLIDFIDLPNKIKEGFNQAKLAVESFLQGFNKVPEIKKITDFLTNPKALGEAFGRNVVVVKKFIDSLQIPKNTIDGFKTAKAVVSDFLSGMNQIPEFKKLTDIFKDGTLRGKFSFDIGKGFGENLVKVKNFFDTLLIPKRFSDGLKEAKSLLSDFLSGLNAVPQIRKFVDSFKDQPSRFNKIANLGEGFGENIVKVKNFFDSLLIPKNFSEGFKEARMSLFVFLEGMKRVPEIKGFIDFLKSPMELGKAFGENIVNAKKFLDSLEAPTNLIDGFKKAKFALSDFLKGMKEVEGFGDVLKVLKGSISTIIGAIGLLFAGKFLLDFAPTFLKNSIDVASRMEVVGTSIKAVSTSTADAAKNMKEFSKQSNALALDKFTFFEGAATFLGATKDTPLEGEVSRRMLNEFSVMIRARNLSKDQQQRALLALGQMASSGTIMTQDLKLQLAQAVPGAYQTFARSMGLNPQQLRKQLSLGNIQSEDLVKFTQQAYAENIGSLPNALDSYQAATDRLGNSLINVQQKVGDALLPIAKIFANIGSSLLNLIEFLIPRLVTLAIASIVSITIKLLTIPGALTLVKFGITGLISGIGMLTKALISLGAIYVVTEIAVQLGKLVWILGTDLTGELGKQIDRQTKLIQEYRQLQSNQNTQPRERYEDNWQNRIWNSLPFVGDESKSIEAVKTLWNTFNKIQTTGRSNTKAIDDQAKDLVSTGQFEDLNKIDAKIESTQAKQKAILQLDPGNFKDFNLMQKELDDLLLSRQVLITSIAPLQSNIAAEIETKKQIIDWLKQNKNNPILSENEAKAFNDELDFAKNQLIVLENLQNNLTKAISKSGTAYEIMQKQLRTVSFTLEDKKAQIEANKAQKLTGITSQVFTNKMTPGELKYQTDNLNVQYLQEGIRNITNSISGYRAVFQSFEATKVLDAFNITESTGISELEKTITLVEDEKSKYVLNQFLDFLKLKRSLVDANLQTSQAQQAARQALIDQTKQVAEYYRASVREAQAVSIEFQKAQKTLEGSRMQNKLREALIGAGDNIYTQFIEGLINIISQTTEMEKRQLDAKKQEIDYQNNIDDIKLRASELQRSLPGKIVPFDENKIKEFDDQLRTVQGSVVGINSDVQEVVKSLGQDAVTATNGLNDAFKGLGDTVTGVGTKLDVTLGKLNQATNENNSSDWAGNLLNTIGRVFGGITSAVSSAITPPTTPAPTATTVTPTVATQFTSPIKNTTIQDLINYKPTFGQSVMGNRPKGRIHNKVDFDSRVKGGAGAEVIASLAGVAKLQKWGGQDAAVFVNSILPTGTQITIEYGHLALNSIKNTLGDLSKPVQVQAGQKLGNVLGHHLDFGVKANGRYINPQVFLANLAKGDYGAIASQPPATAKTKANTVTPASQSKGESVIRMQRLGQKDEFGLEKIQLAVIKQGKIIDRFIVNSGKADTQIFGGAGETKAGSKQPVEFGSYRLGKTTPSGNKAKMGNEFIRLEPDFKTERTAIGFHIDKDRLVDPGSSGCIVFANEAEFNKFKQALKSTGIKSFVFDQAVGAVEIAKNVASQVKPLPKSGNRAFDASNIVSKNKLQSLVVQELNTGRLLGSINSNVSPVSSASTVKLIVADLMTDAINQGTATLQETLTIKPGEVAQWSAINKSGQKRKISELLTQMIVKSDNTAANVLINRLGGLDKLNQLAAAKGYTNTKFNKYFLLPGEDTKKGNVSTAGDVTSAARELLVTNSPSDKLAADALRKTRNFKYQGEVGGKIGNNSKIIGNVGVVSINGKLYLVTAFANTNGNDLTNRKFITNATNDVVKQIQGMQSSELQTIPTQAKPRRKRQPVPILPPVPGTIGIKNSSGISQGGNDLSPEEYAKLTPLGKQLYELRKNKYILALANAVANAEGSDFRKNTKNFGYGLTIGGENVTDFSKHPYVGTGRKPTWIKAINDASTAAGRYQMMNFNASIQAAKKQFGKNAMPDMFKLVDYQGQDQPSFSPGMQDLYFIHSLKSRGVLDQVLAGKVDTSVLNKLALHYASIQSGKNRSAHPGQGTPQGQHSNFLKVYQENLNKLNQLVNTGGTLTPDELQLTLSTGAETNLGAASTKNAANQMNTEAQELTDRSQQLLGLYRLLRQSTESMFQIQSSMKDTDLDIWKTIREGLSPNMSNVERFLIGYQELIRSLEKKREALEKTVRDTQGVIDNEKLLKAAFVASLEKFPDSPEQALNAINTNNEVFKTTVLQNIQAKKALAELNQNIPKILEARVDQFNREEISRRTGVTLQTEKLRIGLLQKQVEQRKLLQQLNPLDPRSARTADLEANLALLNTENEYKEKLNAITNEENSRSISSEEAKKRRDYVKEEFELNKQNIELKRRSDKVSENANMPSRLLERAQFIQDSFKGVQESRSSLLKAYGLDFRAEQIDKQLAITNQQMDFAKATLQLDDFIRKNAEATEANKLTNEQINTLRENLKLTNEAKLDAIKLQFSELGTVVKGVTSSFRGGFKEFLLSTKGFGESVSDLFNSIMKGFLDPLADIASKRMTDALFGWTEGLFGNKKKDEKPTDGINAVKGLADLSVGANGLNLAGMTLNQAGQMLMQAALTLSSQTVANTAMDAGGDIFSSLLGGTFDVLSGSVFNTNSMGFNPTPGLFDAIPTDFGFATLPMFADGGIVGALNKERSITGRKPHLIVASEGERVLNHKETAIWNKLQSGVAGFANGGVVGASGNGNMASKIGNTTTINVPVSVEVGSDSEVDTYRLSQVVQAMVSDGIRREMRVGGSINRGNPYGR